MRYNLNNFLSVNAPDLLIEKKCDSIKTRLNGHTLPALEHYKDKFLMHITMSKKVYKNNYYGLAQAFEKQRELIMKLFSKYDYPELRQVYSYLICFSEYFSLIEKWKMKGYEKNDDSVRIATKYLKDQIEFFVYKYDFLLKDEDDRLFDMLTPQAPIVEDVTDPKFDESQARVQ